MRRSLVALVLFSVPAFAQTPPGGSAMTGSEIATALGHALCDSGDTTCLLLAEEAGKIILQAAGGEVLSGTSGVDTTTIFLGALGQTDPIACAKEDGGKTLCLNHDTVDGVITTSSGGLMVDSAGRTYLSDNVNMGSGKLIYDSAGTSGLQLGSGVVELESPGDYTLRHNDNLGSYVIFQDESGGGAVNVMGCWDFGKLSAAPAGSECDRYWDTDLNLPCVHNGTSWLQMDDFTTVCS